MVPLIIPPILNDLPDIVAGMSTRHGGVSPEPLGMNLSYKVDDTKENVSRNRSLFFEALEGDEEATAFAEQCHSASVLRVTSPGLHPSCDGLITGTPGLGLAVSVADCVPILMCDPDSRVIAAIHAGWRGTQAGIVGNACSLFAGVAGGQLESSRAFIGPAAGPCCYEVGKDVFDSFRPEVRLEDGGKRTVDLKHENRLQLLEAGMKEENIDVDERCTICGKEEFHSYRRDGASSGRMMAYIGIQEA